MTQTNLGETLCILGERENETETLKLAIEACRKALKEYTRESVPLNWAMAQNNLGKSLRCLGKRLAETDIATSKQMLEEARNVMLSALDVWREAGATYYIEEAEQNLAKIEEVITRMAP